MFEPKNEQGVVYAFAQEAERHGWQVITIGSSFPDALFMYDGEVWRVEFEFEANNFSIHNHDHRECDMIVCWINNYSDCPLPIIALSSNDWKGKQYTKCNPDRAAAEYWRQRALRAEWTIKRMKVEIGSSQTADTPVDIKPSRVTARRSIVVNMLEAFGAMGAPELCEKLGEDCNIKASPQTVRDDCRVLVEEGKLIVVGRKWDVVRSISEQLPEPVGFSVNGHKEEA